MVVLSELDIDLRREEWRLLSSATRRRNGLSEGAFGLNGSLPHSPVLPHHPRSGADVACSRLPPGVFHWLTDGRFRGDHHESQMRMPWLLQLDDRSQGEYIDLPGCQDESQGCFMLASASISRRLQAASRPAPTPVPTYDPAG